MSERKDGWNCWRKTLLFFLLVPKAERVLLLLLAVEWNTSFFIWFLCCHYTRSIYMWFIEYNGEKLMIFRTMSDYLESNIRDWWQTKNHCIKFNVISLFNIRLCIFVFLFETLLCLFFESEYNSPTAVNSCIVAFGKRLIEFRIR